MNKGMSDEIVRGEGRECFGCTCYVGSGLCVTKGTTPRKGVVLEKLATLQPAKKLNENRKLPRI
jgi:hypothetical protein